MNFRRQQTIAGKVYNKKYMKDAVRNLAWNSLWGLKWIMLVIKKNMLFSYSLYTIKTSAVW